MKNLIVRALSGAVYVALIIASLLYERNIIFICLFGVVTALALIEFAHMTQPKQCYLTRLIDVVGGILIFESMITPMGMTTMLFPFGVLAYLVVRFIAQLYVKQDNALQSLGFSVMGQMYIALPLAMLGLLYSLCGQWVVLALFFFIWLNDTGAYLVGSAIGRHKLFARISPNKSWEGFFGGFILAGIAGYLLAVYFPDTFQTGKWEMMVLGLGTSLFATFGDLVESLFKRTAGIKDTGHVMPGHGGILDRVDSLLFVSLAASFYLLFLRYFIAF